MLSLCACKKEEKRESREIYALDTVITLTAYGENAEKALDAGVAEIRRLEALFSATKEGSDIWNINHSEGEGTVVSSDTVALLEKAVSAYEMTEGSFDITLYEVMKLWGFTTGEYKVPTDDELLNALSSSGIEKLTINDLSVTLETGTSIDLGGIAKGYIGDRVAKVMKDEDCKCAVISLGGNIRTLGEKPTEEPFTIGIEHPEKGSYFATLETGECSVITSGAYERNFTTDGKFYHHIIDPESGYPADSEFSSVTVTGKDGAMCDALSTAIFIKGADYAKKLYNESSDFSFVLLTKNEELLVSENLRESLSLEKDYDDIKITYFS